jgi:predicted nuclease of predicted toxin-antitoxin system
MIFWLNAQLPPSLAKWLTETFGVNAVTLQELGLQDAQDIEIFNAARAHV